MNSNKENKELYKKQGNNLYDWRQNVSKAYFNNVTKKGVQTNNDLRKLIKPFLTNKRFHENAGVMLTEKNKIVTEVM